jgi:hypothetical protein
MTGGEDVVVGAGGELRRGAGDAVAGVELGDGDDVAVDVAAAVDGEAVERDADDVRGAGGGVDLRGDAVGIAVGVPGGAVAVGVALVEEVGGLRDAVAVGEGVGGVVGDGGGAGIHLKGIEHGGAGDEIADGAEAGGGGGLAWVGQMLMVAEEP